MRGSMKPSIADIRLGAVYRFALKRELPRAQVRTLLHTRAGLSEKAAEQLSGHWEGAMASDRKWIPVRDRLNAQLGCEL